MSTCLSCGKNSSITFHALSVRTLHVRDLGGPKKVQALGQFQDFHVCDDCAARHFILETQPFTAARKSILNFSFVGAAGILFLSFVMFFYKGNNRLVFATLSLSAILCGILGVIQKTRDARERANELKKMDPKRARLSSAWNLVCRLAPKKAGDEDLTYIPVTEWTLRMKNGDLMIEYHLLPEIAVEAWKQIHQEHSRQQG